MAEMVILYRQTGLGNMKSDVLGQTDPWVEHIRKKESKNNMGKGRK
jgi:hypothetical protein